MEGELSDALSWKVDGRQTILHWVPRVPGGAHLLVPCLTFLLYQCAPSYSGQNCSKEPDARQSQPCHNQGTCTSKPEADCASPAGLSGGCACEGDVDECLDRPCHPTGTAACHSLGCAFYCQCLPGHTGEA